MEKKKVGVLKRRLLNRTMGPGEGVLGQGPPEHVLCAQVSVLSWHR